MKEFSRADRVADQLQAELAAALLREVNDPRLQQISIMAVRMSDCLQYARVFWFPLTIEEISPIERKRIQRALDRATPFLRMWVGKKLRLRTTPELRFEYDESIDRGRHMDRVIEEVRSEDAGIVDDGQGSEEGADANR